MCGMRSRVGSPRSGWSFIPTRRGSCIARTATAAERTSRSRSRSAATRSGPGRRTTSAGSGLHGLPAGGLSGQADGDEPPGRILADSSAREPDPRRPRSGDQPRAAGLARILHRVLSERGEPTLPVASTAIWCDGRGGSTSDWSAAASGHGHGCGGSDHGTRAVRALAVLRSALLAGRHEPYESRGSRADLWGPGGEIPPGYPAR